MSSEINGIMWLKVDNSNWRVCITELMLNQLDPIGKCLVLTLCEPVGAIHNEVVDQTFTNWKQGTRCFVWFEKQHLKKTWCDRLTS